MNKILISMAGLALLAAPAHAADLGVLTKPAPEGYIAPVADWSGFYAGVFGSVATGPFDYSLVPAGLPSVADISVNGGGLGGGVQIGADAQFDHFVIGAVADIALTNTRVEADVSAGGIPVLNAESKLTYLGTVRARAGYAFDDVLAYVHGGLAYGRTEASISAGGPALPAVETDRLGFTIGAGVEYQVTENIALQTEYSYTAFDDESILDLGGLADLNEALSFHTLKAGINFRF